MPLVILVRLKKIYIDALKLEKSFTKFQKEIENYLYAVLKILMLQSKELFQTLFHGESIILSDKHDYQYKDLLNFCFPKM